MFVAQVSTPNDPGSAAPRGVLPWIGLPGCCTLFGMKKLPVGTQDFEVLRADDCLYVDKTADIHRLVTEGRVYFLSRPRRFGKSLLVSTLKAIFEGRRDLFEGLAIDGLDYDWRKHPVLHVDFSAEKVRDAQALETYLAEQVESAAGRWGRGTGGSTYTGRLRHLLQGCAEKVAILIDEYDKPILDHIEHPELAAEMREVLKGFYTTIKSCDAHLRFVFLTGVSKFAKMSVFSGLNNLKDISMDRRYATMLGYTQEELERYFEEGIDSLAVKEQCARSECIERIRAWYDGYGFASGAERVYNPFSTLLLFDTLEFRNYWYETGTPTFLVKLIREQGLDLSALGGQDVGDAAFSSYEPEHLRPYPLLYQTGYLTITAYDREFDVYRLDYPNEEVRRSFTEALVEEYTGIDRELEAGHMVRLVKALRSGDMAAFFETLSVFFANIPYDIQLKQEKYYQTIFYLVFTLLGLRMEAEVRTDRGRIDAVAQTGDTVYVFEFKLTGTAEEALEQALSREYVLKYKGAGKAVRVFGVAFDAETRNIGEWRDASLA